MQVMTFPDRVAVKAQQVNVVRLVLSLLILPFWLLGVFVGVLFLVVSWAYAGAQVGFSDARSIRRERVE